MALEFGQPTVSSFCSADKPQCVEVTRVTGGVSLRTTKDRSTSRFYDDEEWTTFVQGVKSGEFDL